MITLTIFGKDDTKQVISSSPAIMLDQKGNKLTPLKIDEKVREIARDIAGHNYKFHRYRINN